MPKELTHWTIADKALEAMPHCSLRESLTKHFPLYLLGSVLPDSPYYYRGKEYKARLGKIVSATHGEHGEDTYALFKRLFLKKGHALSPAEMALACGFLTHIQADAHFHPLVYYFCGNASLESRPAYLASARRHFEFESLMDIHNWRRCPGEFGYRLRGVVNRVSLDRREIARMVAEFYFGDPGEETMARKILQEHIRIQALFSQPLMRILLGLIPGAGLPHKLFYPLVKQDPVFFRYPIRYRHPRSGEWYEETYREIEQRCVNKLVRLFVEIDDHLLRGDIFPVFAGAAGPSLSTGQPRTLNSDMKYFDTSLPIRRLLSRPGSPDSVFADG